MRLGRVRAAHVELGGDERSVDDVDGDVHQPIVVVMGPLADAINAWPMSMPSRSATTPLACSMIKRSWSAWRS